jgi:hypothetical protein
MRRNPWLVSIMVIGVLLLAACGGAPAAEAPTAVPKPTDLPTRTPRPEPTDEPTAEPTAKPRIKPTAITLSEPTAETGELATRKIDMSNPSTYTYKTEIFSIDVPKSWSADDRSSPTEVLVRFTDETENGVVLVDLFENQEQQSQEQLTKTLTDYLDREYSKQENYSHDDPKPQSDGSVLVVWGYDVANPNGEPIRLLGNSFIEQREKLISVLTLALPSEQFHTLSSAVNDVLNSYTIDSGIAIAAAEPTAESAASGTLLDVAIDDLTTYQYDTGLFSIDVPSNWKLKDNSKSGEAILVWSDPTENGLVVVDLFEMQGEQSKQELIDLLHKFLDNSFSSEADFVMNDPKEQSDGSQLIVWSYTANARGGVKATLLGNSFIEQRGSKISILTTAVPDAQFDRLKPETNKIINSYTIDADAALP